MSTTETFLLALAIVFSIPYLVWRLGRTDYWAPLVVVQIVGGVLLGPGVLGKAFPEQFHLVFNAPVVQLLDGLATWGVMVFVWIAGVELDLSHAWTHRRESTLTAGLALGTPLLLGCGAALALLSVDGAWMGPLAHRWQFVIGVGMACAVTSLPILILLMDKMAILRQPLGQRILRYASLDDIAIWGVLALILLDWQRVGRQAAFIAAFALLAAFHRWLMRRAPERDRLPISVVWLALCGFGADWCGLHFMVGAFLAGAVTDAHWFDEARMDALRHHVLMLLMPVFFLNAGLRTTWEAGGAAVFAAALLLLAAGVGGKLVGLRAAGRLLGWAAGEASVIGWLLQTKALIMIVFANILLDKQIISNETFTALLLMAVASTMLTTPVVTPMLARMKTLLAKVS
jgi:Kef-type K+ transport system membrane component KefB